MFRSLNRKTITKTRIIAGSHVVTRYDYGTETNVEREAEDKLIQYLTEEFYEYDAIVISDYNKGVITQSVVDTLYALQSKYKKFLAVDSKRLSFFMPLQPSFVKPNYEEAMKLTSTVPQTKGRIEQVHGMGELLHKATGAKIIALTLDEDGAMVYEKNQFLYRACVPSVASPNVAGAGDTFVSAFTLSSVAGGEIETATNVACAAATIAVRKEATASCTLSELKSYFASTEKQLHSLEELAQLCSAYKAQGKRVVFTNGCFDILHSGHVSYLNRAKQLGDVLIVGMNNDDSIKRLKGSTRPINPLKDRMQVLAGLSSINHIIAFGDEQDDTPISLIKVVQPHIFVKGGDYTRDKLPEADTVEAGGGEIIFLSLVPDHSTTHIIQQIYKTSTLAVA